MASFSEASPALRGYIAEMEAQLKLMSTRAANLSAALHESQDKLVQAQRELAKVQTELARRSRKRAAAKMAEPGASQ